MFFPIGGEWLIITLHRGSMKDAKNSLSSLEESGTINNLLYSAITTLHRTPSMLVCLTLDHRRTETICMMGIVPVQVIGSVSASEILYASPDHPGYAISGFHLDFEKKRDASMIGVAFASHKTDDETSVSILYTFLRTILCSCDVWLVEKMLLNFQIS